MVAGLEVFLVTPDRELWSGEATMVIARGTEGEVGILPGHAPMLLRLAVGVVRIKHGDGEQRAAIDGGFLHVVTSPEVTRVDVLADGATLEGDIDVAAAERAKQDALQRIEAGDETAREDLASAEARLDLTS